MQPETWAELVEAAKALTLDTDDDGSIDIYGLTVPGDNLFVNIITGELIAAAGGVLFDDTNRPQFTSRPMKEVLQLWKDLAEAMPLGWERHGYRDTFTNMYGGKAAMMFAGYGRGASLIEQYAPEDMPRRSGAGTARLCRLPARLDGRDRV